MVLLFHGIELQSQVLKVTIFAEADLSLGSGTGGDIGDAKDRNFGAGGSNMVCNYDDFAGYMSPFEAWMRFNLTTLEDSIPAGMSILYAEFEYYVTNNTGNGFHCYHLHDIDDWGQGNGNSGKLDDTGEGLTWTSAQAYDYENTDNYTWLFTDEELGAVTFVDAYSIMEAVDYEMGESGNKLLTLRLYPTIDDPDAPKKWLGLLAREAPWGRPEGVEYHPETVHLNFYIGAAQPTVFSDEGKFGDINNYMLSPRGFQKWLVASDEGDDRLIIPERPAPINKTPGGLAVYKDSTYGDFDINVKAKLNKDKGGELDPKADFAIVFGYKGDLDYSYMLFTGEDINGFYLVDTTGGGQKTEIGTLNATPAVSDTAYHDYRLVRSGTTVTAYIDGVEYLSVTDDALGAEGMIGMGSYNDIAFFDDFKEGEGEPISVPDRHTLNANIYPNPAGDVVQVTASEQISSIGIRNILGQEIINYSDIGSNSTNLNVSELEPGIYLIVVESYSGNSLVNQLIIN
jgi:hypothetical protein